MVKKETEIWKPQIEAEEPMEGGTLLWLSDNKVSEQSLAHPCQCNRGGCGFVLWGNSLAVRSLRGKILSLNCAWKDDLCSIEQGREAFKSLLLKKREKYGEGKFPESKVNLKDPVPDLERPKKKPKRGPEKILETEPLPSKSLETKKVLEEEIPVQVQKIKQKRVKKPGKYEEELQKYETEQQKKARLALF